LAKLSPSAPRQMPDEAMDYIVVTVTKGIQTTENAASSKKKKMA